MRFSRKNTALALLCAISLNSFAADQNQSSPPIPEAWRVKSQNIVEKAKDSESRKLSPAELKKLEKSAGEGKAISTGNEKADSILKNNKAIADTVRASNSSNRQATIVEKQGNIFNAILGSSDPKIKKEAEKIAKKYKDSIITAEKNYPEIVSPEFLKRAVELQALNKSIDREFTQKYEKPIREYFNLPTEKPVALYYFLTFDMPESMLKSFALDAIKSGGIIVFRGMRDGRTFEDFITKDMASLIWGNEGGAIANMIIDPLLYDYYGIKYAPTIVLSEDAQPPFCLNPDTSFEHTEKVKQPDGSYKDVIKKLKYNSCTEADPSTYYKISGAVTAKYALEQFKDKGSKRAEKFLQNIKDFYGDKSPKNQVGFSGVWPSLISETERHNIRTSFDLMESSSNGISKVLSTLGVKHTSFSPRARLSDVKLAFEDKPRPYDSGKKPISCRKELKQGELRPEACKDIALSYDGD